MIMSLVILAVGSQHLPEENEGFDEAGRAQIRDGDHDRDRCKPARRLHVSVSKSLTKRVGEKLRHEIKWSDKLRSGRARAGKAP
jgi:hypothetical protein